MAKVPEGVNRKAWETTQSMQFLGVGISFFAVVLLGVTLFTGSASEQLASLAETPLSELKNQPGVVVKVSGRLHADSPVLMTDTKDEVVAGRLLLELKSRVKGKVKKISVIDWQAQADDIVITDGERSIPIAIPMDQLKWKNATKAVGRPSFKYEGEARVAVKTHLQYGGELYDLATYDISNPTSSELMRKIIPNDVQVVIIAQMKDGALYKMSGEPVRFYYGSPEEVISGAKSNEVSMAGFAVLMFIGGIVLNRRSRKKCQEMVAQA
ncbi:MAG: hypothetical protein HOM11_06665 [Methylococcales bacterium]|nr:hypothetical protein [Methylococcales bacterium]MBT7445117.1 hypothetical protein [Methylococcales bacterium]